MSKNIHRDESAPLQDACEWARAGLKSRFGDVFTRREGVLNGKDSEDVHQMRVAIRRLRSALRDFSDFFGKSLLDESKDELKHLARSLGKARDNDVAVIALENLCKKAPKKFIRRQIEKKISKKKAKRGEKQMILEQNLDKARVEALQARFDAEIASDFTHKLSKNNCTVKQMGREIISKNLQEFRDLLPSLYQPFDCAHLHELRIAAKRLRYCVELFSDCFGGKIRPCAVQIAEMQDFLGEVHDQDLWIENTAERLTKTDGKKHRANLWLLAQFTKKRDKNYRKSLKLYGDWQKDDFINNLQSIINV